MRDRLVLRSLVGDVLRQHRQRQGRTLRQVSADARVSLGYISEIERGQKEASSEMLAALCEALRTPLSSVLREVSDRLVVQEARATHERGRLTLAAEPVAPIAVVDAVRDGGEVVAAA